MHHKTINRPPHHHSLIHRNLSEEKDIICKKQMRSFWTISCNVYRNPIPTSNNIRDHDAQSLHAKDKYIRGQGYLCLKPLLGLKLPILLPFHNKEIMEEDILLYKIRETIICSKLNNSKVSLKKSQLTISYAFSRSSLKTRPPFLLFFLFI